VRRSSDGRLLSLRPTQIIVLFVFIEIAHTVLQPKQEADRGPTKIKWMSEQIEEILLGFKHFVRLKPFALFTLLMQHPPYSRIFDSIPILLMTIINGEPLTACIQLSGIEA